MALVTSRSFSSGDLDLVRPLEATGLEVVRAGTEHEIDELAALLPDTVAWIAGTGTVSTAHLALAPRLQVVARYGVGVDAVDLAAATVAGVQVTHTPGANSVAVAEHTVALLLCALRSVAAADAQVREGDWSVSRGRQLSGALAGIVGFGRIGRGTARRLNGLGCTVVVHDPYVEDSEIETAGCRALSLEQMCATCQVVVLHTPGGSTVVDPDWTAACLRGQVVVNTARADLVDEGAVADALRAGALGAFAADTLRTESRTSTDSPLLAPDLRGRVTVTPHLGAQTTEAIDQMGAMAVTDVLAVLAGWAPRHPVPAPARTEA